MPRRLKTIVVVTLATAGTLLAFGSVLTLLVLAVPNLVRPLVERELAGATGARVTIGSLESHWAVNPQLVANNVVVTNPDSLDRHQVPLATVDRLAMRLDLSALAQRELHLTQIELDGARVDLGIGPSGKPNWSPLPSRSSASTSTRPWRLAIDRLLVHSGHLHFVDARLKSDFLLTVETQDAAAEQDGSLRVSIDGRYTGQEIHGSLVGASILALRAAGNPYPVDLKLRHEATWVEIKGNILDPLRLGGADLHLELAGEDLSELHALAGPAIAPTPPYHLTGRLTYEDHRFRLQDISGTVGESDLEGNADMDPGGERMHFRADLRSRHVQLADLAGFMGAAPGRSGSPNLATKQRTQHAQEESRPTLLPDSPIDLSKLRAVDMDVRYRVEHIESTSTPVDQLAVNLHLQDGMLALKPISFTVGQGRILANLQLSGRQDPIHANGNIDFRGVDLNRLMQETGRFKGAGRIGGTALIDTTGNSLAQMLADGNGSATLAMSGGDLSAVLVDLAGLDFGNALLSALGLPQQTQVRCMASAFDLKSGVLTTRQMVLDTTEENVIGQGTIDLSQEQVAYRLTTEPKHFSVARGHAPIMLQGTFKNPKVSVDTSRIANKGPVSAVVGAVLNPVLALVPTIQFAEGRDHNCAELIAAAEVRPDDRTSEYQK
jgi:uncharacterized protein involved in outer membrane biogenesis